MYHKGCHSYNTIAVIDTSLTVILAPPLLNMLTEYCCPDILELPMSAYTPLVVITAATLLTVPSETLMIVLANVMPRRILGTIG